MHNVTMHLAGTALKKTGGCFAEVSTDSGDSWLPVVEVLKGNDDGTFYTGTVTPSGANNNSDLQLRFRSEGRGNGGNCYGDDVTVSGTLN